MAGRSSVSPALQGTGTGAAGNTGEFQNGENEPRLEEFQTGSRYKAVELYRAKVKVETDQKQREKAGSKTTQTTGPGFGEQTAPEDFRAGHRPSSAFCTLCGHAVSSSSLRRVGACLQRPR